MSEIEKSYDLIRHIRDGNYLSEISNYIIDCLYKKGPVDSRILEIVAYLKHFQPDFFKQYENNIIEIMGLFFKNPTPSSFKDLIFDMYSQYIQEKWGTAYTPVQASLLKQIERKDIISFSAPTSTGKSFVFRKLIIEAIKDIVVIVPSRALINEYYDNICNSVDLKTVNVLTFVDRINTSHAIRNIFILTPERARELFKNKNWLNIELVLFDEAQLSDEKSTRGLFFDGIVRRVLKTFPNSKIIFAHPFITNPEAQLQKNNIELTEKTYYLNYEQKNVGQIFYAYDNVKEEFYHFGTDKKYFGNNKLKADSDPIEYTIKNGGSVLFYVAKTHILKKIILEQFKKYIDLCPVIDDPNADELINKLLNYIGASTNGSDLYQSDMIYLLKRGIVTHHGSMPLAARSILEHFTQQGFCRLCFATSTLEQGINMPFDVVFIDRFEDSKALSVKNLIGRAGRTTTEKKIDIGSIVVHANVISKIRKLLLSNNTISNFSNLDITTDLPDSKFEEYKTAINNDTFNDEYNLTDVDLKVLKSEKIMKLMPSFLNLFEIEKELNYNFSNDIINYFKTFYEVYLGRKLVPGEEYVLKEAIHILLWRIKGRSFNKICRIRYHYIARIEEKKRNPLYWERLRANFMVGYSELPNKNLKVFSKVPKETLAKDVDYDTVVFDTYDYLDKLIGFKLSDIYYAIFNEYFIKTNDNRAKSISNYIKYGTNDSKEILMLRYGFEFEDIEWLKNKIEKIDETEIVFKSNITNLKQSQLEIIKKFLY